MKIPLLFIALLMNSISGCATPATSLQNEATGQVVRCGGDSSGAMMGGMIGYQIQKSNDAKCVKDYESIGFKKLIE